MYDATTTEETKVTVGLDLGDRYCQVCALDRAGEVIEEGRVATKPEALRRRFSGTDPLRIVLEAGTHSPWVSRLLAECGHSVPVTGFGARVGGFALSVSHETYSPIVLGANPADMALAVNHMMGLGGGLVVVQEGALMRQVQLACGGAVHTGDLPELAADLSALNQYLKDLGCPWDDPFLAAPFLTFVGLPYARMTASGLLDFWRQATIFPPGSYTELVNLGGRS